MEKSVEKSLLLADKQHKLKEIRSQYKLLAGELHFLENEGNILFYGNWWEQSKDFQRWTAALDSIHYYFNVSSKPTSVSILSVEEQFCESFFFPSLDKQNVSLFTDGNEQSEHTNTCVVEQEVEKSCNRKCRLQKEIVRFDDHVNEPVHDVANERVVNFLGGEEVLDYAESSGTHVLDTKKKILNRKYSALNCMNNNGVTSMFSFPNIIKNNKVYKINVDRCKDWIENSGNVNLLNVQSSKLHKRFWICSEHFVDSCFYNLSNKRLLPNAVPTLFQNTSKLNEDQMKRFPNLSVQELMFLDDTNITRDMLYAQNFENHMKSLSLKICSFCKESSLVSNDVTFKCMHGKNCKDVYSAANNMDPGLVPTELQDLTLTEEQLIARVHTMVSVFKLKGQQFGYRGNIINFPQDVSSFAKLLPHKISELPLVVTVRAVNELKPVDFKVRSRKVADALLWLKRNNKFYEDVEISDERLQELPEDGNIYDLVKQLSTEEIEEDDHETDDGTLSVDSSGDVKTLNRLFYQI